VRFALMDEQRVEATPGQVAACPSCGEVMIAKCGTRVVWHWAHKGQRCDGWWEPESPWHRGWKDQFPAEWQETVCEGDDGERHVADVLTSHGLVIEFQHSPLPAREQMVREGFYRNMVWVVDGSRDERDVARFRMFKQYFYKTHLDGILVCSDPGACFPAPWLGAGAIVVFDFGGDLSLQCVKSLKDNVWCLLPGHFGGRVLVAPLPRAEFIRMAHEQSFLYEVEGIVAAMEAHFRKEEAQWFGRPPRNSAYVGWKRL